MLTNICNRDTVTDINCHFVGVLRSHGPALIADSKTLEHVTEILMAIITKRHSCQLDYGHTDDIEDFDELAEHDWVIIDTALDTIVGLAVSLGETFGELWKTFAKPIMKFSSSSEAVERRTSVGIIAECIEGMKGGVTPFTTPLFRLLFHRLSEEDLETKSNAAFGIGLLAEFSNNDREMLASYSCILDRLGPLLQMDEARLKDNAVGCISRMIMKHQNRVPLEVVLPSLVEVLPLKEGFEENEPLYRMILNLCTCRLFSYLFSSITLTYSLSLSLFRLPARTHDARPYRETHPCLGAGPGPAYRTGQGINFRAVGESCSMDARAAASVT